MSHNVIPDGRNISKAGEEWDSGIAFGPTTNTYSLVSALLSEADRIDNTLEDVYDAQHIDTATGEDLDKFGRLVDVPRKSNEEDAKYRARIKAEFAQAKSGATYDDFVEFCATILETNVDNIFINTNYEGNPATVTLSVDPGIYNAVSMTAAELVDIIGGGVPAGHEVQVEERGTFRLKADGDTDDASKGLTSDSISTGGTLAADLL